MGKWFAKQVFGRRKKQTSIQTEKIESEANPSHFISPNCKFICLEIWVHCSNLKYEWWCDVWCVVCADGCNCRKPIAAYRCLSFSYHARKYYILHFKAFIVLIYYYAYNKTVCHLFLKLNVYLEVFVINIETKCKKTRFWKTFPIQHKHASKQTYKYLHYQHIFRCKTLSKNERIRSNKQQQKHFEWK